MTGNLPANKVTEEHASMRRRLAERTASIMFLLGVAFLGNIAAIVVVWVDVPRVRDAYLESHQELKSAPGEMAFADSVLEQGSEVAGYRFLAFAAMLWPVFLGEWLWYWLSAPTKTEAHDHLPGLAACVFPPLRIGLANPVMGGKIWLPKFGWCTPSHDLRDRLDRFFGIPMVVIALMILPVLMIEFGLKEEIAEHRLLRAMLHISTGTIWFAFAFEFLIKFSVADSRVRFCKEHWLDLAIILLPLISFLRSLRAIRATRLAKLAKVQQLAKLARTYHLRGLAVKGFRGLLVFEALNRLLGITPEKRLRMLENQLRQKEAEIEHLRHRIEVLQKNQRGTSQLATKVPAGDFVPDSPES